MPSVRRSSPTCTSCRCRDDSRSSVAQLDPFDTHRMTCLGNEDAESVLVCYPRTASASRAEPPFALFVRLLSPACRVGLDGPYDRVRPRACRAPGSVPPAAPRPAFSRTTSLEPRRPRRIQVARVVGRFAVAGNSVRVSGNLNERCFYACAITARSTGRAAWLPPRRPPGTG